MRAAYLKAVAPITSWPASSSVSLINVPDPLALVYFEMTPMPLTPTQTRAPRAVSLVMLFKRTILGTRTAFAIVIGACSVKPRLRFFSLQHWGIRLSVSSGSNVSHILTPQRAQSGPRLEKTVVPCSGVGKCVCASDTRVTPAERHFTHPAIGATTVGAIWATDGEDMATAAIDGALHRRGEVWCLFA